jgi:hypothetical protein
MEILTPSAHRCLGCTSPKYNPAQDGLGDEVKDSFDSTPRSKWLIDDGG